MITSRKKSRVAIYNHENLSKAQTTANLIRLSFLEIHREMGRDGYTRKIESKSER